MAKFWLALALTGLVGCAPEEPLDGFLWDVELSVLEDGCLPAASADYTEQLPYRLVFDGSYVDLAIGPDLFATGAISGCEIAYDSVVWGQNIDGYTVRWSLAGEATYRPGGDACNLSAGTDWLGTETFTILSSDHPDIAPGCELVLHAQGAYAGEAH
ncbi:MAG: hypothetical protein JXX28_09230 [Deltaproteobacteria bacterium]|nr:hypothetical protein [Deltaproteobacteria bacterium]